jgi:membrane associated rhomboid family serine protease
MTVILIVINVLVFFIDRMTGRYQITLIPVGSGFYRQASIFIGGLTGQYALVPQHLTSNFAGNWITIFTSEFLHANWLHIGGNMLYLWIFGSNVEDTLGRTRFLIFYVLCGVVASAAHTFTGPQSLTPTVGASGAIAGLMGAYLVLFPRAEILTIVPIFFIGTVMDVPAVVVIGFWAVLQFINASWLGGGEMIGGGGVAYFAHIGGFFFGIALIILLGGRRLVERRQRDYDDETMV